MLRHGITPLQSDDSLPNPPPYESTGWLIYGVNITLKQMTMSSSREVQIRVPFLFSAVYFSRGVPLPTKIHKKQLLNPCVKTHPLSMRGPSKAPKKETVRKGATWLTLEGEHIYIYIYINFTSLSKMYNVSQQRLVNAPSQCFPTTSMTNGRGPSPT